MSRRRAHGYAPLTSLLDVLFILVFASLAHAAAVGEAESAAGAQPAEPEAEATEAETTEPGSPAAEQPPPGAEPPPELPAGPPLESGDLYDRALATVAAEIREKHPIYVRISRAGDLTELEDADEDRQLELSVRLVERVPDPDVRLAYVGDRVRDMRVCSIVRHHLGREDLQDDLVIVIPSAPLELLPVALVRGLRRDQERCLRDQLGLAVLIQPRQGDLEEEKP